MPKVGQKIVKPGGFPVKPSKNACIACSGTGQASNGARCRACVGTGIGKAYKGPEWDGKAYARAKGRE